jgi:membrane fusion protein (multidrug efflux system)
VYVATTDTVTETVLATGAVEAIQSIELRPEMQGRLVEIMAREGREVRRGTPLFKIDDAELRALVAQLEAERDQAVQALQRTAAGEAGAHDRPGSVLGHRGRAPRQRR